MSSSVSYSGPNMCVAPDIAAALKMISIVEKEQISGILFF
jgi:hypothetical protein